MFFISLGRNVLIDAFLDKVSPQVGYKSRGPKSSNLTNDSHHCRRTQPVKINPLDMAQGRTYTTAHF